MPMTETTRQILSVVSHMMFMTAVTSIALASCEAEGISRLHKAFTGVVALGISALCFYSLVAHPRFSISIDHACGAVAGANVIALWAVHLATRRRTPAVN